MKHLKFYLLTLLIIFVNSCGNRNEKVKRGNIFIDPVIKKIYTLQDNRDTENILHFLKDKNPLYRRYAALALGSVQDVKSVPALISILEDKDIRVKAAAAYSLGQIGNIDAEIPLMSAFSKESDAKVKNYILEALGKTGSEKSLKFLVNLTKKSDNGPYSEGIAMGFYRFVLRKIHSEDSVRAVVGFIGRRFSSPVRFYAANFLARLRGYDLSPFSEAIFKAVKDENDIFIKMNLILSLGKVKGERAAALLISVIKGNEDYRVRVNALRALRNLKQPSQGRIYIEAVKDNDYNVSLTASQILSSGDQLISSDEAIKLAGSVREGRISSLLLRASLKSAKDKKAVSKLIKDAYGKSSDKIEKGLLLEALSGYSGNFNFISEEIFNTSDKFISTSGMTAIAGMIKNFADKKEDASDIGLKTDDLIKLLKKGVISGDSALSGISSSILREPKLNMKEKIKEIGFIEDALKKCVLPRDVEQYRELKMTLNYFKGIKDPVKVGKLKTKPVDWELVKKISSEARVLIETERGNIDILLLVNASPGSVSNFVNLIGNDFYRNSIFHRVVPNFVIQDGCPRGDGWGSPGYSIRSEFFPVYYSEGSVGMASAGKDTEGSQWFITHSPTPHLDGRYTVFGRVIRGMEVVHKIRLGDRIRGFKIFL